MNLNINFGNIFRNNLNLKFKIIQTSLLVNQHWHGIFCACLRFSLVCWIISFSGRKIIFKWTENCVKTDIKEKSNRCWGVGHICCNIILWYYLSQTQCNFIWNKSLFMYVIFFCKDFFLTYFSFFVIWICVMKDETIDLFVYNKIIHKLKTFRKENKSIKVCYTISFRNYQIQIFE